MTDRSVDDLLAELKGTLDVAPSTTFAASVRTRIEASSSPRGLWPQRAMWAVPALVAIVVGVITTRPPVPTPALERAAVVPERVPGSGAAPLPVANPSSLVANPRPWASATATVSRRTEAERQVADSLAVVTDQGAILRRAWARTRGPLRATETLDAAIERVSVPPPLTEIVVAAIDVPPISVTVIETQTTPTGSGSPVIRRLLDTDVGRSPR